MRYSDSCATLVSTKICTMKDHTDVAERHKWNAFKAEYRKSHPTQTRNNHYYEHVRKLYKDQNKPSLEPWIRNRHYERQEPNVTDFEAISRILNAGSDL